VPANQWFTKYVCYAKNRGWIVGYENGKYFRPTQIVSFVEGLKIALKGFSIDFEEESDVWYRQAVKRAAEKNLIPFTIKAFHNGFQRDQMADLIARILKENRGELEEYLGDRADLNVSYETINQGRDLSKLVREVICAQGGNCNPPPVQEPDVSAGATITFNGSSYDKASVTIPVGQSVKWVNSGSSNIWPASNSHPSHTDYPGTNNLNCGTPGSPMFDACTPIVNGETFEFTFLDVGSWGYHDHLNTSLGGTITVVE